VYITPIYNVKEYTFMNILILRKLYVIKESPVQAQRFVHDNVFCKTEIKRKEVKSPGVCVTR